MPDTPLPAPMTVTAVNWIAAHIETHREQLDELTARPPAPWAAASEAEQAHTAGLVQTHQRVLATLYEGHYRAHVLDTMIGVPPGQLSGWFDGVLEPLSADLRAHEARKDLPTPEGAYSHAAADILTEFETTMKLGRDLDAAGHFGIPIPSHHFGDFDGRDTAVERVFGEAISHHIDGMEQTQDLDPDMSNRHYVAVDELRQWHAQASFATYDPGWRAPDYMTPAAVPEPPVFAQHPEPPHFAQHPDIAHRATGHDGPHPEGPHRGLER